MSLRIAAQRNQSYGSIATVAQKRAGNAVDDGVDDRETTGLLEGQEVGGIAGVAQEGKRVIGVFSAVFIILNRMIGTAIFATPSTILIHSGSVGLSLLMWIFGGIFGYMGMHVYIIWGSAFPRSGGEKNYLEYMFPRPKYLSTSVYSAFATLLAYSAGNSLVFGEYFLKALSYTPTSTSLKLAGFGCITFTMFLHGTMVTLGLRIQNILGMFKIIVLLIVIGSGIAAYCGHLEVAAGSERPWDTNFSDPFKGSTTNPSAFSLALYNALWGYAGFSNVNYALSEVKNPARTIRIAGPIAIMLVAGLYILANVAYFAAATKEEITGSGRLVAAVLFRNVWGGWTERILSAFVAFSALGNVMSVMFSQARVNQELGREGILPFSKFWASGFPFDAPLSGLSLHWLLCTVLIFTVSAGDAYEFVINIISYPLAIINAVISFGIVYLSRPHKHGLRHLDWPVVSPLSQFAAFVFGILNTFLFLVPLIKPPPGSEPYESLPYWVHAVGGWAVFGVGAVYWVVWARLGPWLGGYRVEKEEVVDEDGLRRGVFVKVPKERID